jgi:hypothetical protein
VETTVSWRAEAWPRLLLAPGHAPGHAPGRPTLPISSNEQSRPALATPWLRLGYALATPWLRLGYALAT